MKDFRRDRDRKKPICAAFLENSDLSDAINMPGDEMAVDAAVSLKRTLQVHQLATLRELQTGADPGFTKEIKFERAGFFRIIRDRQATAVDCNAVASLHVLEGRADR